MTEPVADWPLKLRTARKALRLSRAALARRAGISSETLKAYELGLRQPSRPLLTAILDALPLDRVQRDDVLLGAGFAPDGPYIGPDRYPNYMFTVEEAQEHVDGLAWPAFVVNDVMEVVAVNRVATRLWGVDLAAEFTGPHERNMLRVASNPRFGDRIKNWDEMVSVAVGIFRIHYLGHESLEDPSPYFSRLIEDFMKGDPGYVARFLHLWQTAPDAVPKVRWSYPVVWQEEDGPELRFLALVTTCNEPKGLAFNDWIPLDAPTWEALG